VQTTFGIFKMAAVAMDTTKKHKLIKVFGMGFTYDFYANRWRMCSISYYFRNSSASINDVTNVNYDIDLQKMYMYSCKMPQVLCLTRWG
jgi:hypothetical protein